MLGNMVLDPGVIFESFDVVPLFTSVPLEDTLQQISRVFSDDNVVVLCHALRII